jgi:hypothetical protein
MTIQELVQKKVQKAQGGGAAAPGGAPAGAPAGKKAKGGYAAPELPKSLNPAEVHQYYMSMADFHDKKSWMNKRLSGLKPLWSDARGEHEDKHLFHKAMRDGFAQKALAVDLAAPQDAEKKGFGEAFIARERRLLSESESASPERILVSDRILTLEQFMRKFGKTPLEAMRSGQLKQFTIVSEAFGGSSPTGALSAVNNNHTASAKALPMHSPFPSQAPAQAAAKIGNLPKMPGVPDTSEAVRRIADGGSVQEELRRLLKSI